MSSTSRLQSIGALAGATALALSLALGGCSSQEQQATTTETEEQATQDAEVEETTDDIAIPDIVSTSTNAHKTLIADPEFADPEGFEALPTRDMDLDVEAPDIPEADENASKAPSGYMNLAQGGIQMSIPSSWKTGRDADGFVFTNAEGSLLGFMFSNPKAAGTTYDFEAIVQSIPQHELNLGYTAVEIISTSTLRTESGKSCGQEVLFWEAFDGGEYIHYISLIESKSYINTVEFMAAPDTFAAEAETIGNIINTLYFLDGEIPA